MVHTTQWGPLDHRFEWTIHPPPFICHGCHGVCTKPFGLVPWSAYIFFYIISKKPLVAHEWRQRGRMIGGTTILHRCRAYGQLSIPHLLLDFSFGKRPSPWLVRLLTGCAGDHTYILLLTRPTKPCFNQRYGYLNLSKSRTFHTQVVSNFTSIVVQTIVIINGLLYRWRVWNW